MVYRILLFDEPFLGLLQTTETCEHPSHVADILETVGRQHDGFFTVNYIRLRFVVQKTERHHYCFRKFQFLDMIYDISCFNRLVKPRGECMRIKGIYCVFR